ncbi:hypothetical protein [Roseicella aerolata]|uniref:SH3 domain-containing protein n=1 Tax=Roseicella aerolata TaxID=2883479 RepID=A0A9X1IJQ4_9PROT|nr:hypothetical protein [Roseicella aerolata]MCB4825421.1 hypothetical protein [Roseicella aerolata]
MKRIAFALFLLAALPAAAQEVVAGYVGAQVRVRAPGETGWRPMPAAQLPAEARILAKREASWVEIEVPGAGRLQLNWNDVRQRVQVTDCQLPGRVQTAQGGSQGLSARGC